jgi:hypothetical protein
MSGKDEYDEQIEFDQAETPHHSSGMSEIVISTVETGALAVEETQVG